MAGELTKTARNITSKSATKLACKEREQKSKVGWKKQTQAKRKRVNRDARKRARKTIRKGKEKK